MANPTYLEVFGANETDTLAAMASLGLPVPTDARGAVLSLLERLKSSYATMLEVRELNIYRLESTRNNIDIDTQRRTFTITLDLALVPGQIENEAI
jgi:hypothetical protein